MSREEGFLETIAKYKGIQVIEKNRYASGGTAQKSNEECMKMADKLKEADGVFCSYEQSTMGMLRALRSLNLSGKVKFIGFDIPAFALEALKRNESMFLSLRILHRWDFFVLRRLSIIFMERKFPRRLTLTYA